MAVRSILIVDDDPAVHDLLRTMLSADDWRIESAMGGEEALSHVRAGGHDIVLTDIVMPGMDGLALLRRIREVRPEAIMVVMTAVNTPANVVQSLSERAYAYLSKPFSRDSLNETLRAALADGANVDDINVLSARPHWISLELRCRLSTASRLTQFFRELGADLNPEDLDTISMAFRELLTNAIEHGGRCDPTKKVHVTYVRGSRCVFYYMRDPGEGFSLDRLPHAAISNSPDRPFAHAEVREALGIRPGGFGIFLTRNLADEVIYNEKGNEVILIKYLKP